MDNKVVIFDADGTLINSIPSIAYHVNQALEEENLKKLDVEEYKYILGYGAFHLVDQAIKLSTGEKKDKEFVEKILKKYDRKYKENPLYLTEVYDGIKEVLEELKHLDYKLACFSNKQEAILKKVISGLFPQGTFDMVLGQKEGLKKKPDKEGVDLILKELKGDKKKSIFIGDTEVDIKTGENAKVYTIAVGWGFRKEKDIKDLNYDILIEKPSDILKVIGEKEKNEKK